MAVPRPKLTAQDYLAIERQAEYKSEFYRGEMFAMAGGTENHADLGLALASILRARLAGLGCKVFNSDMKVRTGDTGLYTYPDVSVVCGKRQFAKGQREVLINPKLIIEVLSKSTEAKDRGFKFQLYKQIESLEEYVLVSQHEPLVERFGRPPHGAWSDYSEARGLEATLILKSLDLALPLSEIYHEIEFDQPDNL